MLQVVSAVSGEDIVLLNAEELEGKEFSKSALKAELAEIVGVSRFRLRLFREDNSEIQGDDEITENMLKLVILQFLPFCDSKSHEEKWISACMSDDAQVLQALLEEPLDPDSAICEGRSKSCCPLHIAAMHGRLRCVRLLLQACANKELREAQRGLTPLLFAAQNGHMEVVRFLIEAGSDKDKADNYGSTPLHTAASNGHVEVVRCLVEAGSDKDKPENCGSTPLHFAALNGHLEMVRFLIEAGSDKDKTDNSGQTPLHPAAFYGHMEVVRFLIEAGSDKDRADISGSTPLAFAADNGHMEVARFLTEIGSEKYKPKNQHSIDA